MKENLILEILEKHSIYTLFQAATILKIKPDTLLRQVQRGKHISLKVGNTWLIVIK